MDAFKASKPCDTVIGTVTKINPVTVRISQKMTLSGEFLGATQTALASIKKGDKVLMLRKSGGQKYYIIDKVVDELWHQTLI